MTIDVVVAFLEVARLNFPLELDTEQSPLILNKWHLWWYCQCRKRLVFLSLVFIGLCLQITITNQEPEVRSYGCMYFK